MDDLISRKAAIALWEKYNPIIALDAMQYDEELRQLPSAQPESLIKEIVYCKDCIHHFYDGDIPYCNQIDYGYGWEDDDFCSFAERRTDE